MLCQLPEEKLLNIEALCKELLSKHWGIVELLQKLMGCVTSTRPTVQMSRARFRGIQRTILDYYRGKSTTNKCGNLTWEGSRVSLEGSAGRSFTFCQEPKTKLLEPPQQSRSTWTSTGWWRRPTDRGCPSWGAEWFFAATVKQINLYFVLKTLVFFRQGTDIVFSLGKPYKS